MRQVGLTPSSPLLSYPFLPSGSIPSFPRIDAARRPVTRSPGEEPQGGIARVVEVREVLHAEPWSKQREILEALRDPLRVTRHGGGRMCLQGRPAGEHWEFGEDSASLYRTEPAAHVGFAALTPTHRRLEIPGPAGAGGPRCRRVGGGIS